MTHKYQIEGMHKLKGEFRLSGAKNVALKALAAALLVDEPVEIHNVPRLVDVHLMADIVKDLGVGITFHAEHSMSVDASKIKSVRVDMDRGAKLRTSSMLIAPLLARTGEALIPNPGGCRLGARPIDRHIAGLQAMGASIEYNPDDGFFHAKASKLHGVRFRFEKNTHTGTETLMLAAVLASGETIIENAALEPEVDDLITLLNSMGAKIRRAEPKKIIIEGVKKLHGTTHSLMPDRNEAVTVAIAAYMTRGDITVHDIHPTDLQYFFDTLSKVGAAWEMKDATTGRFFYQHPLKAIAIETAPEPGFMTDWQGPWSVLMTQALGHSTIHETVFEDRFGYVNELKKTGARIEFFNPKVTNPREFYNFNWDDNKEEYNHAIKISGPTDLHDAVMYISDIRAGATLVLAALGASGTSIIHGVELLNRGYEKLDERLNALGAHIKSIKD